MTSISKISAAVVLAGALSLSALASTAEASVTNTTGTASVGTQSGGALGGRCTASRGNYGTFTAYYVVLPSGTRSFYRFAWYLGGPQGRQKNNVRIRIRRELIGFADRTLWEWDSADDVVMGPGGYTVPFAVGIGPHVRIHADATFVFDRSGIDPRCTARSPRLS